MNELAADYDFALPAELIASRPLAERDASRMLVLHRGLGQIEHRRFRDLCDYLKPGDLVVLNDSRVIKARLLSHDRRVELLLIESMGPRKWNCLVKPGRKMRPGFELVIAGTTARVREILEDGSRLVEFDSEPDLARLGSMPIPPYFRREADEQDEIRYQTVFAEAPGSVAAPTAGLHFTPELLSRIPHAQVTLHVGIGTFLPIKVERIADHSMHSERYLISENAARAINAAARILAVGTTSVRVLESQPTGPITPRSGSTNIFIYPPYTFRRVGALLTNFHLPKSTLLMLVCAFAGREEVLAAYAEAIRERYRFFSYGDCMLVI
ncbi:MAG TPA: tRNA preQ1(34) S-adenosylmethionine ribosyltransferase-isomerase QueA [Terrimicrobiaceae bacterium]